MEPFIEFRACTKATYRNLGVIAGLKCSIIKRNSENLIVEDRMQRGEDIVMRLKTGKDLTLKNLLKNGFHRPILVEKNVDLGLTVPTSFGIRDLEKVIGPSTRVPVIDVYSGDSAQVTMEAFRMSWERRLRGVVLNCINHEISKPEERLDKLVTQPQLIRDMDWILNKWPSPGTPEGERAGTPPRFKKFVLMSPVGCFTDFHFDFGGVTVWLHIVSGQKIIFLIPPTPSNMEAYRRYMRYQGSYFLPEETSACYRLVLNPGHTLFLPGGWLHAVYTSRDCIAYGGHCYTILGMGVQIRGNQLEKQIQGFETRAERFEEVAWRASDLILDTIKGTQTLHPSILEGLEVLVDSMKVWLKKNKIGTLSKTVCKDRLKELQGVLKAATTEAQTASPTTSPLSSSAGGRQLQSVNHHASAPKRGQALLLVVEEEVKCCQWCWKEVDHPSQLQEHEMTCRFSAEGVCGMARLL